MRGRVPALAVVLADLLGREQLLAGERVHERRLADARGAEERDRPPGREVRADELEAVAGDARDRVHGDAERDRLDLEHAQLELGAEVGLRQDDHGLGAALPGGREVALEPPHVEVLVQRHEQEDGVDVRREHLLLRGGQRDLARERRPARQDGVDRRRSLVGSGGDGHPVADGGQVAGPGRLVREPAGHVGAQLAELGEEDVRAAMLRGDARGHVARGGVWLEIGCVAVSPAEFRQCVQASLLERDGLTGAVRDGRLRGSRELPEVYADEPLEPRSSEGEGGKRSHLGRPPSSSGTSRSMPAAGDDVECAAPKGWKKAKLSPSGDSLVA